MKNVLIILTSIFSLNALSQNQPVFRQWYAIPGLYNPALVGDDHARNISVLHRRQWTSPGIGPEATGLLFQHAGNHRLDYGVSLTTNTVVRLTNSDARFILAYGIPLGPMTFLRFGMSGGLAVRKLDLGNDDYSNDPAVLRAADGLYGFSGSAGLSFQRGGFQLAASLPAVLPQESYSPAKLAAVENSQLLSQWYTVRYRIRPQGSNIEVDPWAVYRVLRDQRRNWEAGGLVTFKKAFSLGLSWNSTLGAAVITGFRFSGVEAGYTWEPGTGAANPFGGSHELRVTVKVGQHTGGRARKSTVGENGKSSGPAVEVSNT
ncbi:MAG: PorP/SprF family type IX secretion system membrane protein, partial [Bacteroidota bacterium]